MFKISAHLTLLSSDGQFYYASYITNDTSHPILGMYSPNKILTSKLDDKWFNRTFNINLTLSVTFL